MPYASSSAARVGSAMSPAQILTDSSLEWFGVLCSALGGRLDARPLTSVRRLRPRRGCGRRLRSAAERQVRGRSSLSRTPGAQRPRPAPGLERLENRGKRLSVVGTRFPPSGESALLQGYGPLRSRGADPLADRHHRNRFGRRHRMPHGTVRTPLASQGFADLRWGVGGCPCVIGG
jgi:hypothetical protein